MQDNIVVSGDKKGQVAVWDFDKVHERTVYAQMHRALANNIKFLGPIRDSYCASSSADGRLKVCALPTYSCIACCTDQVPQLASEAHVFHSVRLNHVACI